MNGIAESISPELVDSGIENKYLVFRVNNIDYGISVPYVLQIIGMQEITGMPEMPPYMKGIIQVRGAVVPVVSLRLRFGIAEDEYTDRTCIIIVRTDGKETGLIVDAIRETVDIDPKNISPTPGLGTNSSYIAGIARLTNGHISLLIDLQLMLSGENLF